jgi:WD40 repeat protein
VLNRDGHTAALNSLAFSPDEKYLFSGGLDKVVHVWEFRGGDPRLERSIRPPIRRTRGLVMAIAVSPIVDDQARRFVAIAGFGPLGGGEQIFVYRYPGPADLTANDLAFTLPTKLDAAGRHKGPVFGLAFSPNGRYLASSGQDKTVRVWDLGDPANEHPSVALAQPDGHVDVVRGAAFLNDQRLVSFGGGDKDGTIRFWDWQAPRPFQGLLPMRTDAAGRIDIKSQINAFAVSRDGRHVVVGRENGELYDYETDTGVSRPWLNRADYGKYRAIEAIALRPDGRYLAVSSLAFQPTGDYPRTECDITLWSIPECQVVRKIKTTKDLAQAMAFSPTGRFLVIAGGEAQEIAVVDRPENENAPIHDLRGPSTVLWHVGFVNSASKPTIAYSRNRPLGQERPAWEGFDLPQRQFVAVDAPEPADQAITSTAGWSIVSDARNPFELTAHGPAGERVALTLNQEERRWTCYSFIPPVAAAGHSGLTVAVGTQEGYVMIFGLPDGRRTRVLAGHTGAIHGLAPSSDGRWLATASADETIRLWSLKNSDKRSGLGAKIERDATGGWVVTAIEPRGFAQQMGLRIGERIGAVSHVHKRDRKSIASDHLTDPLPIENLDASLEDIEPGSHSLIRVERLAAAGPIPALATNRFDQPVLNILAAPDKEWVVWMPEGFYDTSIAGDLRLLGWHINKIDERDRNNPKILASEFHPMKRYEALLHRKDLIDRVIQQADAVAVGPLNQGPIVVNAPPAIRFVEPANVVPGAEITVALPRIALRVEATGAPGRAVQSLAVNNNSAAYAPKPFAPPAAKAEATFQIDLPTRDNAISVVAVDDQGVKHIERFRVRRDEPQNTEPDKLTPARLVIRSIGIGQFDESDVGKILFASDDADKLADFLEKPLVEKRFQDGRITKVKLARERTTSKDLEEQFESLAQDARNGELGPGDTVFVVINSHAVKRDQKGLRLLTTESRLQDADKTAVAAEMVSTSLEYVAARGCLVVVLFDGIHNRHISISAYQDITNWIRDMNDKNIFVLVASKQEESEALVRLGQSLFAYAVKNSTTVAGGARESETLTLDEFGNRVKRLVKENCQRSQQADLYLPDALEGEARRIRIFEPQPRLPVAIVGK